MLFEDEVYDQIRKDIIENELPLLANEVIDDLQEKKYNIHEYSSNGNKMENPDQYFPGPETIPTKEEFPGHLNFQLLLPNQSTSKHWVYSQTLQKVFINMEQTLPLRFKWEPPLDGLYLRTSMVFSLDQYRNDPVQRCHNHMASSNRSNQDIDPRLIKHVVRCSDPLSMYEERNEHLSIVTPLRTPQAGSQYVQMYFQFLCKNSCTSGMNRRPTELVFTLEDGRYKIIGRRRLLVRVCSCPKRDKEKEEADAMNTLPSAKKRKLSHPMPQNKKVMLPSCDTHVYNVQLNIIGKENYLAVMKYAFDVMAGQAARTGQFEFFKPYMDEILHKMP
ncbi:hypothetical protein KPH14_008959 [Odynerus spinipes]|uniref:p53 DNA-binding domain-containing protein n=1 Tax=Odynerus spinipes TaxID=1348599 RepID=A0AAD9RNK5_9HYME|nr:hypothetical protein KPH14_008959 [Odynerus spinipes]